MMHKESVLAKKPLITWCASSRGKSTLIEIHILQRSQQLCAIAKFLGLGESASVETLS
jgi:hypothetical protein